MNRKEKISIVGAIVAVCFLVTHTFALDMNPASADARKCGTDPAFAAANAAYCQQMQQQNKPEEKKKDEKPPEIPKPPEMPKGDDKGGDDKGKGGDQQPGGGDKNAKPEEGGGVKEAEKGKTCSCNKEQDATECRFIPPTSIVSATPIGGATPVTIVGMDHHLFMAAPGKKYVREKAKLPPETEHAGKFLAKKCKPKREKGKLIWKLEGAKKVPPGAVRAGSLMYFK